LAKWEIERPEQVIDILGLWGDAVDNIPGIPGVGEKTAKTLIKQYGSVEEYHCPQPRVERQAARKRRELCRAGLAVETVGYHQPELVPVELDEAGLEMCAPSKDLLEPLFAELEFRTLGRRVFGDDFSITETRAVSVQTDLFGNPLPMAAQPLTVEVQDIYEAPGAG
jgi:DNA polymerase-1